MHDAIQWDAELIRRYDQPGPRYTSYPTAVQFDSQIGTFDLLHALRDSRRALRPLSLYLHLPFCANVCYYCACNKVITKDRGRAQPYLECLEAEIRLIACHLDPRQPVEQLHLGGGTPTFLSHSQLRALMSSLRKHFNLRDGGDYSIELDPREADWSSMGLLRELGFNRVSLGVQDLDPAVQRAINRLQSLEQTRALVDAAHTLQFRSVNIDLIYGLPKQTVAGFAHTLGQVIELQPDRLSLFNYAHLPERFMPQRRIDPADLPSAADKLLMLQGSIAQLGAAGYRHIGMDHFALADDELAVAQEESRLQRNFQGYTTHGHCDLIGLGVSAISHVGGLYSQNETDLMAYQGALGRQQLATQRGYRSSLDDRVRGAVIQHLMCNFAVEWRAIGEAFGVDWRTYFAAFQPRLREMASDGLVTLHAGGLQVTPAGRLLVRAICGVFDAYWPAQDPRRFSQVI